MLPALAMVDAHNRGLSEPFLFSPALSGLAIVYYLQKRAVARQIDCM